VEVQTTKPSRAAEGLEFEEFFRAEFPAIVRGFLLAPDLQEAEELAQEAMARAYERWDRVRTMASPTGYVYRTGVNLNRRRLRHLAVRARRLIALGAGAETAVPPDTMPELGEALASLSAGQRGAFLLVEWLGMTSEEAGRILRIAPASVRSRVHRAREALRDRLRPEEERDG
jgi:RNA polymerase sigma factor (sigma-70 family)